jgi:hypothetical protein
MVDLQIHYFLRLKPPELSAVVAYIVILVNSQPSLYEPASDHYTDSHNDRPNAVAILGTN